MTAPRSLPASDLHCCAPATGSGSAERHRSYGAVELAAPTGLRRDVDEFHELLEAQAIGVGPHTAAAFIQLSTRATA